MPPISASSSAGAETAVGAEVAIGDQLAGGEWRRVVAVPGPVGSTVTADRRAGTPGARDATYRSGSGRRTAWSCSVARGCRRRCPARRPGPDARDVGGARLDHEVGRADRRRRKSGSSGCSGTKIDVAAALGDEVEAVVEELAEEREPGVERRGQARRQASRWE